MFDLAVKWSLKLAREQLGLEEVVVFVEFCKFTSDMAILLCHELIEFLPDLVEEKDKILAVLEAKSLDVMLEIAWSCEFVL